MADLYDTEAECQNCDWRGLVSECDEISDIAERVAPGETMPAGECPECGALASLASPSPSTREVLELAQATIERLTCINENKRASVRGTLDCIQKALQS